MTNSGLSLTSKYPETFLIESINRFKMYLIK